MIPNLDCILVIGTRVVPRDDETLPLEGMRTLAAFSTHAVACQAVRMLRRNANWLTHAELLLIDSDYLEIQSLAHKLKYLKPVVTTLEDLL